MSSYKEIYFWLWLCLRLNLRLYSGFFSWLGKYVIIENDWRNFGIVFCLILYL